MSYFERVCQNSTAEGLNVYIDGRQPLISIVGCVIPDVALFRCRPTPPTLL